MSHYTSLSVHDSTNVPPSGPPTEQEIWKIARRTTKIIQSNITRNVCLFGSAACSLWTDIDRVPNDIDILVSKGRGKQFDPEYIKDKIVGVDDRYYVKPSRIRGAKHCILYCRLPGWSTDETRCVKVDIVVPPTLNIPRIMESKTTMFNGIPVMPIFDLLVMKTQGWWDHGDPSRGDFRAKESADVSDIFALLPRVEYENVSYDDEANEPRHSQEFMSHADTLVNEFVQVHGRRRQWRALGFDV